MGLDTTHDAWSGPYTAFDRWRRWVAKQEGIPLDLMEGFMAGNGRAKKIYYRIITHFGR